MATKSRLQAGDGDPRHGTVNGYTNLGCHCQECKEAWRKWHKEYRDARRQKQEAQS